MGEVGKRGIINCCPNCQASNELLKWNTEKDECFCSKCDWSTGPNWKYLYNNIPEQVRIALRHYGPEDKFNKAFFINLIDKIIKESLK